LFVRKIEGYDAFQAQGAQSGLAGRLSRV